MSDTLAVFMLVVAFLVGFPLFWWLVLNMVARIGGWAHLAAKFASRSEPKGDHFAWRSGRLGWLANYSNCLDVWVGPGGLWLRPIVFFRPGHATLMIPWTAVTRVSTRQRLFTVECAIAVGHTSTITLYGKDIAASIAREAPVTVARG